MQANVTINEFIVTVVKDKGWDFLSVLVATGNFLQGFKMDIQVFFNVFAIEEFSEFLIQSTWRIWLLGNNHIIVNDVFKLLLVKVRYRRSNA